MVDFEYYSLADLTRMCGSKRRTVQLWAESGALVAEPETDRQGPGVHRIYSRDEAIIAMILSRVTSAFSLPIGRLLFISKRIRRHLVANDWGRILIEGAIRGTGAMLSIYADGQLALNPDTMNDRNAILNALSETNGVVMIVPLNKALGALRH